MDFGIDTHGGERDGEGNSTYIRNLSRSLVSLNGDDTFALFAGEPGHSFYRSLSAAPRFRVRAVAQHGGLGRILWALARAAARERVNALHVHYFAPLGYAGPIALTVHDLAGRICATADWPGAGCSPGKNPRAGPLACSERRPGATDEERVGLVLVAVATDFLDRAETSTDSIQKASANGRDESPLATPTREENEEADPLYGEGRDEADPVVPAGMLPHHFE